MSPGRTRSWWGWGFEEAAVDDREREALARTMAGFGFAPDDDHAPPPVASLELRPSRVAPPASLAAICASDPPARAAHTHGKAFRDVVRNLEGRLDHPPDLVARPRTEADVVAVLDWCADAEVAVIPYGGGSSVVGGVEARIGDGYRGVVSLDLTALDRVLEVDATSRAARVQAGVLGPALEDQLRPDGWTLRHFPQSFEFSSLGGWIATRAGGHFATGPTHIDDLVEAVRAVTPVGPWESRRLPGSGAGPSPDRLLLGSEGALGVVTEAWLRLQVRPRWRGGASVRFPTWTQGVAAVRALAQSGLQPANCRLLDGTEAALTSGVSGVGALLVLGFESADHPVGPWLDRGLELCRDHGGEAPDGPRLSDSGAPGDAEEGAASREGAAGEWRSTFLRAPYTRDALARLGLVVETFETACPWDRVDALHGEVTAAAHAAVAEVCGPGVVTCRFTHAYPDGPAPYFSVYAQGRWGDQVAQWDAVKVAVSEALAAAGGTITHHHAVGRDHRPWYDRQRPEPFAVALRAAKAALDPTGILNPGVLV
ncbi:FAD-binding oxidoreductase [Iamia majanohamensis]|uniref:FAD-binding oxidoreductase n=1 Tax=Iamia majanohamensis TaxID=467976 RepID=A0AAF0BSQ3_9ACTN|nr:FAD-binding oxidoreductase [Iamia majanohamensis]WCO68691.1 FAD-binding oxidoreductase [Iamia majanohamensis]